MQIEDNERIELLQTIAAAFNRHDLDAIMACFAGDAVLEMPRGPDPWGQRYEGTEQVRSGLASRFAGMPDVRYDDARHWACGDFGVSEWTLRGTTTEGQTIEVRGCDHWTFRDDKVIKKNSYWKIVDR